MKKHYSLVVLAAASLGLGATAGAVTVHGPDALQIQSATVHYDAADVRDSKSARQLFMQIRQAAEEVCSVSPYPRGYEIWSEHSCEANAVARAVGQADLPALDRFYSRETATGLLR